MRGAARSILHGSSVLTLLLFDASRSVEPVFGGEEAIPWLTPPGGEPQSNVRAWEPACPNPTAAVIPLGLVLMTSTPVFSTAAAQGALVAAQHARRCFALLQETTSVHDDVIDSVSGELARSAPSRLCTWMRIGCDG